jgi:hypothetical protein
VKMRATSRSVVVAGQEQVSADLANDYPREVVILDLKSGTYFELQEVGARVWDLLQRPRVVGEIINVLLDEYEVETPECESQVCALLDDMAARGLIEIRDESNS